MSTSQQKEMKALLREAERLGCSVDRSRRHTKVTGPNGATMTVSGSPSSTYAATNARKEMRVKLEIDV